MCPPIPGVFPPLVPFPSPSHLSCDSGPTTVSIPPLDDPLLWPGSAHTASVVRVASVVCVCLSSPGFGSPLFVVADFVVGLVLGWVLLWGDCFTIWLSGVDAGVCMVCLGLAFTPLL